MRSQSLNETSCRVPRSARNLPGAGGLLLGGTLSLALWGAIAGVVHAFV